MHRAQRGFTLVELVATIILIGIVAVTVLPRFSDRSGFAEYTLQDQIISLLRVAQQRAMYDHGGSCYGVDFLGLNSALVQVVVDADGAGGATDVPLGGSIAALSLTGDYAGLSVTASNQYFDGLGNSLASCGAAPASATIDITGGDQTVSIEVHASGYIQKI